jgi:hypothetical protein
MFRQIRRSVLALAAAAVLTTGVAGSALADTATQKIDAPSSGKLAANITDFAFAPMTFSVDNQTNTGTMTLNVTDGRGGGQGWNVTVKSGDFAVSGSPITIPAGNFSITTANGAVRVNGQPVRPDGPRIPASNATGTLDSARRTLESAPHNGNGAYTQALDVSLVVPGGTEAGTYVATLTVTITSGL